MSSSVRARFVLYCCPALDLLADLQSLASPIEELDYLSSRFADLIYEDPNNLDDVSLYWGEERSEASGPLAQDQNSFFFCYLSMLISNVCKYAILNELILVTLLTKLIPMTLIIIYIYIWTWLADNTNLVGDICLFFFVCLFVWSFRLFNSWLLPLPQ